MTFREQAKNFMIQVEIRKRNPVRTNTLISYRSLLNHQILPFLGNLPLENVQNGTVRGFVQHLSESGKSPATILGIISLVKAIVKSAVDQNGNQLYPRTWNNDFMDLPQVTAVGQEAPVATPETVQQAISRAIGPYKALYALLAGSGLRIGEALALKLGDNGIDSFWDSQAGTLTIRSTAVRGKIQPATKTEAGTRQVDLHPTLNSFLRRLLLGEKPVAIGGLLFPSRRPATCYEHAAKAGISGFHSFRRFRVTHLRKAGIPDGLIQWWIGHSGKSITDRYDKIGQDIIARKQFAAQAGLGFQLEVI